MQKHTDSSTIEAPYVTHCCYIGFFEEEMREKRDGEYSHQFSKDLVKSIFFRSQKVLALEGAGGHGL